VITNLADITGPMRKALSTLDPGGAPTILHRTVGNALIGKGLATKHDDRHFVITEAGARVRDLAEREQAKLDAPTIVVNSLSSFGWTMLAENDFGGHAITTWTRDEHTLVLSWTGAYEVSAAIYDGLPLPLDQVAELVMSEDGGDTSPEYVLDLAARRARVVVSPRFAFELSELLTRIAADGRAWTTPRTPATVRVAASQLAAAILSTPHAR
jgi:hypothetical protein